MKKRKIIVAFFVIAFGLLFSPIFFACSNFEIVLNKPTSFGYQIDEETGKQLIVVEANKYASNYLFGIGTSYDGLDTQNFLTYEVSAKITKTYQGQEIQADQNYLDVTNIFKNTKTYYYYVQYKGAGDYKDSEISNVKSVTITSKLDTPRLSLSLGMLSWTSVDNATTYTVCAETDDWREVVSSNVNSTEYDVSSYISRKADGGLDTELRFFVYANSHDNYVLSSDSNKVSYSAHLYLQTPSNFAVKRTAEALTWSPVTNAQSYTLKVNNLQEIIISENDYVLSGGKIVYDTKSIYNQYGLGRYEFAIKANGHGKFVESSYSSAISDLYTQKLLTPQNVRCVEGFGNYVEIMWDVVENANVYVLKFSDTSNNYALKQFRPNDSNGIPQDITFNSITLSYEQLGISNILTLNNSNFEITVQAQGYNYFTDSDFSQGKLVVTKSQILLAPVLENNSAENMLTWNAVVGATKYVLSVEFNGSRQTITTTNTYFDYADIFASAGEYKVKCYAVASNEVYNSIYSNEISIAIISKLDAPVISNVVMDGDYFVVNFTADSKSESHMIYVNDNLITSSFVATNPKIFISDVIDLVENDILKFKIKSNATSFWDTSAFSNEFEFVTKLTAPTIQILGDTLSWNNVQNASNYVLILDDVEYNLNSSNTSVDLNNYVGLNTARQVAVKATNNYLTSSNISQTTIYNRARQNINNFTNKYFYYGQTYDYFITDADELFALVEYSFFNFLPKITGYIDDYDSSTTITSKIDEALDNISATKGFSYQITKNASRTNGEFAVTINHKSISSAPTYTPSTTQYSGSMIYSGNATRTADHVFASDNYIVSQDVYTTDGLLSAVQNRAKPNFVGNSNVPQQIYQIAKNILIEIIDDTMTDFEKALAIHDYVVTNISYDYYGLNNVNKSQYLGYFHYIESALLYNLGVCDAYSKTFALLCNMEGITCIVADGLSDKTDSNSGHAWNKIYLDHDADGELDWFAVDCTYDDAKSGDVEYLFHEYFLIPDSYLFEIGTKNSDGTVEYRQEDANTNYPPTTVATEGFYSNYNFDGTVTIKITSQQQAQQIRNYMLSHPNAKIELIIARSLTSYLTYKVAFGYSFDSNYYVVFTNN